MFGAPDIPGTVRYGIRAAGDKFLIFGSFDSMRRAVWYGISEFGVGNYTIVIL